MFLKYSVTATFKHTIETAEANGNKYQEIKFVKDEYDEKRSTSAEWWVWLISGAISWIALAIVGIIGAAAKDKAPELGDTVFSKAIADCKMELYESGRDKTHQY